MYNHLDVPLEQWVKMDNFLVKYYYDTVINRLSIPLISNIRKDIVDADVIHIQMIFNLSSAMTILFACKMNKPVLLSPRGVMGKWIMENGIPLKKIWLKIFIKPFANLIHWHATSEQEALEIQSHYPHAKIHIIPNGIDINKTDFEVYENRSGLYAQYISDKHKEIKGPVIVSMGRIHAKKGFDILINSFDLLMADYPEALLFIVGQNEGELSKLKALVATLNLEKNIYFITQLNGKAKLDFLANADVFALSSHNENFGNVYLESLAVGTPVVASTKTPWKEVVEFSCGMWVKNSIEDFHLAMLNIIKHPEKYTKENCQRLANKYSLKSVGELFSVTFKKMFSEKA
ncbi:MAG: glycosyltransferase [Cytophagales bacterium]|nr:glycosyltransferase [Cytophaga sp.]